MSQLALSSVLRQRKANESSFIENPRKQYNARIYRYSRNVKDVPSAGIKVFQHWGVIIHYLDVDEEEHLPGRYIYEANNNGKGQLYAIHRFFKSEEDKLPGAVLDHIADQLVCKDEVENFCQDFNQEYRDYELSDENCQKFTNELLIRLGLPTKYAFIDFLQNAAYAVSKSLKSSYISLGNIIGQYIKSSMFLDSLKKVIKYAILRLQITTCGKTAELLVNEMIENGLYKYLKGAFCWWQLFQVLSEIISRYLTEKLFKEKFGSDEKDSAALAYGSSKVASLSTAAAVGGFTAGPAGVCGAVLFWLVAEIIFAIIRSIATHFAGEDRIDKFFGQADYTKFFETCEKIVVPKIEEICASAYKFYFSE